MEETPKTKCSGSGSEKEDQCVQRKGACFSEKEEIKLLEEYKKYREEFGTENRWAEFHKKSELRHHYSRTQISEKIRTLKKKFEKMKNNNTASSHPRLFQLSNSLWGLGLPNPVASQDFPRLAQFFRDEVSVPQILRSHWVLMGTQAAHEFEKRWTTLYEKELTLLTHKFTLKRELCQMLSEIIKSNNKHSVPLKNTYSNDDAELCEHPDQEKEDEEERDESLPCNLHTDLLSDKLAKSKDKKKRSHQKMEGDDLPIVCVENQQSGHGMSENDDEKAVVDGNSSKVSAKKKGSRKKKKKETAVEMKTQTSGFLIEELVKGDPNGKLASRERKITVHYTAKLKGSERIYESTIGKAPRTVLLGDEQMIDGFCIGVEGMRVGGKRRLIIPPSMGYGEEGFGNVVPPNSWLEYEVELLGVRASD